MNNLEKTDLEIITEKFIAGMQISNRKLVEAAAAKNESLIVGDENGNPIAVPAKELLKRLQK